MARQVRYGESALDVLVNWAMKNAMLASFGCGRPCVFHHPATTRSLVVTGALALAALSAGSARAQPPGESITGQITKVELVATPRTITVDAGGRRVTVTIANRTRVTFAQDGGQFPNPGVGDLQPGMVVRFNYTTDVLDRIRVLSFPDGMETRPPRPAAPTPEPGPTPRPDAGSRTLKVRILDLDDRRGEFRADVAGRRETFRVGNPRDLGRFAEGDLVVIRVEGRGGSQVVTDIRSAGLAGRVTRLDRQRGEVTIDVDGRRETYGVAEKRILDDLREGDSLRFEFEDRSGGRKVITSVY